METASITRGEETPLPKQEQSVHIELLKIENQALYNDNNTRVTQRNYLVLGIFVVSTALLPLAVQGDVVHRQMALVYNIVVFFLMLLWGANTDKIGEQNGEIRQNEKKVLYQGVQTRRAINRTERRTLTLPSPVAVLLKTKTLEVPHVLAVRWGKQYWGTVGLVLSTDLLFLSIAGLRWDALTVAAVACTIGVPVCIRHERPMEEKQ